MTASRALAGSCQAAIGVRRQARYTAPGRYSASASFPPGLLRFWLPVIREAGRTPYSEGVQPGLYRCRPDGRTGRMGDDQLALITSDPAVLHGQAVIAGTRVPVSVVLDCLAAGMSAEQTVAEYPTDPDREWRARGRRLRGADGPRGADTADRP